MAGRLADLQASASIFMPHATRSFACPASLTKRPAKRAGSWKNFSGGARAAASGEPAFTVCVFPPGGRSSPGSLAMQHGPAPSTCPFGTRSQAADRRIRATVAWGGAASREPTARRDRSLFQALRVSSKEVSVIRSRRHPRRLRTRCKIVCLSQSRHFSDKSIYAGQEMSRPALIYRRRRRIIRLWLGERT